MNEPRILVADDDKDAVLSLTALLRQAGYEVRGVHRGAEVAGRGVQLRARRSSP